MRTAQQLEASFSQIVSDNLGAETVISNTIGIDAVNDVPVSENGRLVSLLEDSGISNVGFESINFSAGGGIDEATQEIYVAIKKEDVIEFSTSTGNGSGQLVFLDPDDTNNLQYLNEQYFGDSSLAILTEEEVKQLRFKTEQNSYGIQRLEYYIIDSEIFAQNAEGLREPVAGNIKANRSIENDGLKEVLTVNVIENNDIPTFSVGNYTFNATEDDQSAFAY